MRLVKKRYICQHIAVFSQLINNLLMWLCKHKNTTDFYCVRLFTMICWINCWFSPQFKTPCLLHLLFHWTFGVIYCHHTAKCNFSSWFWNTIKNVSLLRQSAWLWSFSVPTQLSHQETRNDNTHRQGQNLREWGMLKRDFREAMSWESSILIWMT